MRDATAEPDTSPHVCDGCGWVGRRGMRRDGKREVNWSITWQQWLCVGCFFARLDAAT